MFEKEIVIDGRGHLVGRLASKVAKELLNGQKIVVVRCDLLLKSGSLFRSNLAFHEYLNKRRNTNPRKGPYHQRSPARIFFKAVRGMLPRKTARGEAAMSRLKCFDGIPFPYDTKKRMVVPDALKILRLKSHRKYTVLGELAAEVGWTKKTIIDSLEDKRKVKSQKYYQLKSKKLQAKEKAKGNKDLVKINEELAKYGF